MKKYKVNWGNGSCMTVTCNNALEAIKIVCKKWKLEYSIITCVNYMGDAI